MAATHSIPEPSTTPASSTEASGEVRSTWPMMAKRGKKRALVTGGAGFIGSHLCERLLLGEGYEVICVDNLRTGSLENIAHLRNEANFRYVHHDVTEYIEYPGRVDEVYHFASPASPADFERIPIPILKVGALGTYNSLGFAKAKGARLDRKSVV